MNKRITFFILFAVFLCSALSWGQTSLRVSTTSLNFSASGGQQTFTVNAVPGARVSVEATWVTVSPEIVGVVGSPHTITVTVTAHTSGHSRTAHISVRTTDGSRNHSITVTQDGAALSLSGFPTSLNFTASGEQKILSITSNVYWTVGSDVSWLTFAPLATIIPTGIETTTLTITAAANPTITPRTTTIRVYGWGAVLLQTISVTQDGAGGFLSPSVSSLIFSGDGEQKTFSISSNTRWTVNSDASWLTASPTGGSNNGNVRVTATTNTNATERTATITISGTDAPTKTISVTQTGRIIAPSLSVSTTALNYTASSYQQYFTITSNANWTVNSNASWLTVSPSSGSKDGTVSILASANHGTTQRTATITVNVQGIIPQTINVTQFATQSGGLQHTWNLTSTMTAMLDISNGILTIKTTQKSEEMPDFYYNPPYYSNPPWYSVRSSILSIIIETGVESILYGAFLGCDNLTSVSIPNTVKTIGIGAFQGCSSLTFVAIPNSLTTIKELTFAGSSNLASVIIPNSITAIDREAFSYCKSLVSLTIPNSVTTIDMGAFAYCSNLAYLTIPNSITEIGPYVFSSCNNLKEVTVNWIIPLSIGQTVFYTTNINKGMTLHVPFGTENLYKAAPVWQDFNIATYTVGNESIGSQSLKAYVTNGILHITGLQTGKPISIYGVLGQLVYSGFAKAEDEQIPVAARGVYIVTDGKETIKIIAN